MTPTTIAEMKKAAEAATQGGWFTTGSPWFRDSTGVLAGSPDGNIAFVIADCEAIGVDREEYEGPFPLSTPERDAAHIAASCPANVLALIADRDALLARAERAEAALARAGEVTNEKIERVAAALDALDHGPARSIQGLTRMMARAALEAALTTPSKAAAE